MFYFPQLFTGGICLHLSMEWALLPMRLRKCRVNYLAYLRIFKEVRPKKLNFHADFSAISKDIHASQAEQVEGPPILPAGGSSHMLRGLMLRKKLCVKKREKKSTEITKPVKSIPKINKFITFHCCTVGLNIIDVLRPTKPHFLQRQHKL